MYICEPILCVIQPHSKVQPSFRLLYYMYYKVDPPQISILSNLTSYFLPIQCWIIEVPSYSCTYVHKYQKGRVINYSGVLGNLLHFVAGKNKIISFTVGPSDVSGKPPICDNNCPVEVQVKIHCSHDYMYVMRGALGDTQGVLAWCYSFLVD